MESGNVAGVSQNPTMLMHMLFGNIEWKQIRLQGGLDSQYCNKLVLKVNI